MRIYFMGICGTAMGNAALLMRECGHEALGADTGIYPPMSTTLQSAGVDIMEGYDPERLARLAPDLVVVGNAQSRGNPEVEWLLDERALPFCSLPELLSRNILSTRRNIVIAGTHGKTTTTAMTACLLRAAGRNPGWLVGGVPRDLPGGSFLGGADSPFVIEGDEYDSAFFDKRSKFIHYAPRILVLNNIEMDHADIFRDLDDVLRTFRHVCRVVPGKGWVLANGDDANVQSLLPLPWTRVLRVGCAEDCDLRIANFGDGPEGARFDLCWQGRVIPVRLCPSGLFNARNAAMALLAAALGAWPQAELPELPLEKLSPALASFQGVQRRQQVLLDKPGLMAVEDFGHHPTALASTIEALRARHPGHRIVAAFEPRSNTASSNLFQREFTDALAKADTALIAPVHRAGRMDPKHRLDTAAIARDICARGGQAAAASGNEELLAELLRMARDPERGPMLVCFFSNGAFGGIISRFAAECAA
ncbi:MAG: Mur ligase family protein [Opitutales bacterium]|jgi:UDP-N-acetylmuramate: L-alanyl-gamma-D-glutamyl-meso-diaminopimelate ligase